MGRRGDNAVSTRSLFLLLVLVGCAATIHSADSAYLQALHSTLRVEDARGRTLGAAVCLGDGIAVTAAHVIRDQKLFRLAGLDTKSEWQRAPLVVHPFYELALVEAPVDCPGAQPASPTVTDEVFTLGFPQNGWEQHASFGRVGSVVGRYVRTNILVARGNSGGGLWTLEGRLVGICSGKGELGAQFVDIRPAVLMVRQTATRAPGRARLR
ncbi:MAG TPA: serine protease [Candidatus Xenobia bacterium]|nr:serine protease [Candidatus Xenobia bacterium]